MKNRSVLMALMIAGILAVTEAVGTAGLLKMSQNINGTVMKIQPRGFILSPKTSKENLPAELRFTIIPETRYEKINSLSDLKKGDNIKVRYKEQDGQKVATRIKIISAI